MGCNSGRFRTATAAVACGLVLVTAVLGADPEISPERPNEVAFEPVEARFVRFTIHASLATQACIDELEIYGPEGKDNLALAADGAKATASSCLPGYPIHQIVHLNDGLYGNSHSWIAARSSGDWAQIELPQPAKIAKVVFSRDREGQYRDRLAVHFDIRVSPDGKEWRKVAEVKSAQTAQVAAPPPPAPPRPAALPELVALPSSGPLDSETLLRYAFTCEAESFWNADRAEPVGRVLGQMEEMIARFAARGLDVSGEQAELTKLKRRLQSLAEEKPAATEPPGSPDLMRQALLLDARLAKRRLLFRDPDLAPLEKILFVKRHPYKPSHNYSDIMDSQFRAGGGVCVLEIPRHDGCLEPAEGKVTVLFDAGDGIPRDPVADFQARTIYFAYRPSGNRGEAYWHLMAVDADGGPSRQLTHGPYHDYYPCPLPGGDLTFISTRCRNRFLCWVPQSMVLFRMDGQGNNIRPLSHANLSEWAPSVMSDGRIIWTRSEYLDKGANFGHTLWSIRPDGTHPELIYGNNTKNCCLNGREVPGTEEICCTLISHFGDFNGPIALIDTTKGRSNPAAAVNITPDVRYNFDRGWPQARCFRDPVPISRDYILVSHAPADRFGLYLIDRFGNREVLYLDAAIGSMCPTPLRAAATPPPAIPSAEPSTEPEPGQFVLIDVYQGLTPAVERGTVKYLRVCEEVRSELERLPNGRNKEEYPEFQDYYAAPTHKVTGPHGWPSFVAKGVHGIVPVKEDGSANFYAPAGKVLYFQALDENFNEIQRMRSVVQLQPGEKRSCIGCHEGRTLSPPVRLTIAARNDPRRLEPPPWGAGPFSYPRVVQPVLDAQCVRCHDAADKQKIDLTGRLDDNRVPASYRTLISQGWVHHFSYSWGLAHHKAQPLSFGTVKSRLWNVLDSGHHDVKLSDDESRAVKCWTDLNCPLWPDYRFRQDRPVTADIVGK